MVKKKINLKKAQITDGQLRTPDSNINTKTIDEIIGVSHGSPFKVATEDELKKKLSEMNLADMQAMAVRVGLLPVHDRVVLHGRILSEFKKDYRRRTPYQETSVESNENLNMSKSAAALRILGEGK